MNWYLWAGSRELRRTLELILAFANDDIEVLVVNNKDFGGNAVKVWEVEVIDELVLSLLVAAMPAIE